MVSEIIQVRDSVAVENLRASIHTALGQAVLHGVSVAEAVGVLRNEANCIVSQVLENILQNSADFPSLPGRKTA